jgi:hypothetical protein
MMSGRDGEWQFATIERDATSNALKNTKNVGNAGQLQMRN